jgi:HD-GYP domain-containing protein (c-di-GMP phosphodiesterase class II)
MTRIVPPGELPLGARVARDVLSGHAAKAPLLRAGVEVTESYRRALERAGIGGVYVDDEAGNGIQTTPALGEQTRLEVTNALSDAFAEVSRAQAAGRPLERTTVSRLERAVTLVLDDICVADTATLALASLAAADAYTLEHSIDVTVLGLLLGNRIFRVDGRIDHRGRRTRSGADDALRRLGLGLLLHDVGKVGMPLEILLKPGPLDDEEMALVRTHPLLGLALLDEHEVSAHATAVVRWHHERWDGLGYPYRLAGDAIPQFARIAAVADVYSALTTRRPYRAATAPDVALEIIRQGAGTQFDTEVVDALCAVVAPFPPGSAITLADGRSGVVAAVQEGQLDRPLVRVLRDEAGTTVEPYEVDLATAPGLVPAARPATQPRA